MKIELQDPENPKSSYTVEAILEACADAEGGAGVFAFASNRGVELLFEDKSFRKFLSRAPFELVVGLDAVTNTKTLETLQGYLDEHAGLNVFAFIHNRKGVIFHPKYCWFKTSTGGAFVLGSGNLTPGGLTDNWEAFVRQTLNVSQRNTVVENWDEWKRVNAEFLKPIDDASVIAKASLNARFAFKGVADGPGLVTTTELSTGAAVLIAEIPKSDNRWNQANFNIATFTQFFQATAGGSQRVFLTAVRQDGTLGDLEMRPCVSVKSQNYRVELGAAAGLDYPAGAERPIAVFVRFATRQFRYQLLMPGDTGYIEMSDYLTANWNGPNRQLRRIIIRPESLRAAWPDAPVLGTRRGTRAARR